jgi:hypothetical protein
MAAFGPARTHGIAPKRRHPSSSVPHMPSGCERSLRAGPARAYRSSAPMLSAGGDA